MKSKDKLKDNICKWCSAICIITTSFAVGKLLCYLPDEWVSIFSFAGFFIGGAVGSWWIAKFVIGQNTEEKIKELEDALVKETQMNTAMKCRYITARDTYSILLNNIDKQMEEFNEEYHKNFPNENPPYNQYRKAISSAVDEYWDERIREPNK